MEGGWMPCATHAAYQRTGNQPYGKQATRTDDGEVPMQTVTKRIEYQDGQWCVVGETTGRQFGCYSTEAQAQARLAQVEALSKRLIDTADDPTLVALHDGCHKTTVTHEVAIVHEVIEEVLEARGWARPYTTPPVAKQAEVERLVPVIKAEDRYTLGPVYVPGSVDSDGETIAADDLQKALWEWVRKGDRTIYLQHSEEPAGEMVEILTWPFPIDTTLDVPGQEPRPHSFPSDTPFMGVVWQDWAWDAVKNGDLRGYSIGGRANRVTLDVAEPVAA